ncbi:MAG: glucohydrolase, partial [Bacilli bacterium]|nr:glucohydrolase [Bacilli bacterium]
MVHKKEFWWKSSIGYIIYPEAYCDSNDDGIGDLQGIISKLDYIASLGVDLLWICPFFASPMDDNGYDVKDYRHINPIFGSDEDFLILIRECHARGIKLLVDFVLNHTSDEHPFFQIALADPSSKERG